MHTTSVPVVVAASLYLAARRIAREFEFHDKPLVPTHVSVCVSIWHTHPSHVSVCVYHTHQRNDEKENLHVSLSIR